MSTDVYVKGLERRLPLRIFSWDGRGVARVPAPAESLRACPVCSFVPVTTGVTYLRLCTPSWIHGLRSGKLFITGPCVHLPAHGPFDHDEATAVAARWNGWAAARAERKADAMGLVGDRRAHWLDSLARPGRAVLDPSSLPSRPNAARDNSSTTTTKTTTTPKEEAPAKTETPPRETTGVGRK